MSLSEVSHQSSVISISCLLMTVCCLLITGCGFEPMYAGTSSVMSVPGIEIASIPDRDGQYFRNQLIDRLGANGRPADAPYQLKFSPLSKNIVNLGVRKDATATRAQMQVSTQMQLVEKSSGAVLLQRPLRATGAYNLLDNQLATLASQQNMTESLLQEIGDDAMTELNLYFRRKEPRLL